MDNIDSSQTIGVTQDVTTEKETTPDVHFFPEVPPLKVIKENTINQIEFNVMSSRPVKETLYVKEYHLWQDQVVAVFDREYSSAMKHSPDHLIFLTALVHLQKLIYVLMCEKFGLQYVESAAEVLKIWPTKVVCEIPKLVRPKKNLKQSFLIDHLVPRADGSFFLSGRSYVGSTVIIGEAIIFKV